MYKSAYTKQFEKDLKKAGKRNKDLSKIKSIITRLLSKESLSTKHKNHKLVGSYVGRWECHIEPDWLLIYKIEKNTIIFERTGSHSSFFK